MNEERAEMIRCAPEKSVRSKKRKPRETEH